MLSNPTRWLRWSVLGSSNEVGTSLVELELGSGFAENQAGRRRASCRGDDPNLWHPHHGAPTTAQRAIYAGFRSASTASNTRWAPAATPACTACEADQPAATSPLATTWPDGKAQRLEHIGG